MPLGVKASDTPARSDRVQFWYEHVEAIQGDGYKAICSNQVYELCGAMDPESLDGLTVSQLGSSTDVEMRPRSLDYVS
jgi:hypothetical protein